MYSKLQHDVTNDFWKEKMCKKLVPFLLGTLMYFVQKYHPTSDPLWSFFSKVSVMGGDEMLCESQDISR